MSHNMDKLAFTSDSIVIYEQTKIHRLQYKEILSIIVNRPYLVITTTNRLYIYIQISLSKIAQLLPNYFCLCNQSTIINLLHFCSYKEQKGHTIVELSTSDSFIVSRRCKKNVKDKILHLIQKNTTKSYT